MPQPVETVPVEEIPAAGVTAVAPETPAAPAGVAGRKAELPRPAEKEKVLEAEPVAASETEEVDLSTEWASLLEETKERPAQPSEASSAAHVEPEAGKIDMPEFVVEDEKAAEAPVGAAPGEPLVPAYEETGHPEFQVPVEAMDPEDWTSPVAELSQEVAASREGAAPVEDVEKQGPPSLLPGEEPTALSIPEHAEVAAEGHEPALEEPQAALPVKPGPQPELEVDQEFELVLEPEDVVPPHEMLSQIPPKKVSEAAKDVAPAAKAGLQKEAPLQQGRGDLFTSDQFLSDLAREIDDLGLDELTPTMSQSSDASRPAAKQEVPSEPQKEPAGLSAESGPLKEVFEEFRAELGEMGAEDEDLETHYNLGIAFREMGLLEEAIGEFQKVAKANDRGKAFRYAMQCSTLLGLAFMEKGQPDIAAIWYERALTTPGLDSESKLALRYDLGVAQESAGDLEAALKSFSQVYAVNIDYRDVAERIASLQKPAR
jgi:hypothetical protein